MKFHILLATALAGTMALSPAAPAFAWGHLAHAVIDRAAIEALPQDGPVFLRDYLDYITASATLPDKWRSSSEPFAKIEEDPNHGWFREQFDFLKPLPRSRHAFILALYREHLRIKDSDPAAAARMNVRWTGTLPYAAMEQYGQMVAEMRLLRAARVKGDAKQAIILEQNIAHTVVRLGHYIGDGAEPLHDSVNSDGWRGANPKGFTRDGKIHSLFESQYVSAIGLTVDDIRSLMPATPGAVRHFHDFVERYASATPKKDRDAIYRMRSRIVHSGRTLRTDISPFDMHPAQFAEDDLWRMLNQLVRLMLRNWLADTRET